MHAAHGERGSGLRRRAALVLPAVPAIPLLVGACGRGTETAGANAGPVTKPVTITTWYPPTGNYTAFLREQTDAFQAANPKVTVSVEPDGGADKLQAVLAGGDPPDLQQSNFIPMFSWAKKGVLEAVDPYLDKRGKGDYHDWARDGSTVQGKLSAWPWMLNPTGVVANVSLFEQKNAAHLLPAPGPKADWTFDQWKAALKAVTVVAGDAERDVYGTGFLAGTTAGDYWQLMYLWSTGAELYDREETKVTICSPEGVAGLQMLVDLVHRDRLAAPGVEQHTYATLLELFMAKRMGILNGSPATVGDAEKRLREGTIIPPFKAQFLPTPHAPGKKSTAFVAIQSFLVFRQERDKDRTRGAMQLGHFLTDNAAQKAITPIGELPVRKSAGNLYPDDTSRTTALATIESARSMGRFPENGEIRKLWQQAAQAAFTQQKAVRAALDEMCQLAEPIMARNRS
jgi:multiple sugar transport system substrate-binding protein